MATFPDLASPHVSEPLMRVSNVSKKKKARSPMESTANKQHAAEKAASQGSKIGKNLLKGPRICPNVRVVVLQGPLLDLIKALPEEHPAMKLVSDKNPKFPFVGQVMKAAAAGNKVKGRQQHPIKFDLFPADNNVVVCPRGIIRTLYPDEDEPEYDEKKARLEALAELCEHPYRASNEYGSDDDMASVFSAGDRDFDDEPMTGKTKKRKAKPRGVREMEYFLNMQSDADIAKASTYKHFYGEGDEQFIEWEILRDGEEIVDNVMQLPTPTAGPFGVNIPWSRFTEDLNYTEIFFTHFFPSLVGKASVLDEYLASPSCSCHGMVLSDKIQFHRPDKPDPDFIVSTIFSFASLYDFI